MNDEHSYGPLFAGKMPSALDVGSQYDPRKMTAAERDAVVVLGNKFAEDVGGGVWLLISGQFSPGNGDESTESRVKEMLRCAFGYPEPDADLTLNVLLNSPGGSLDSAYTTVLYLSAYAKDLNVYVPDRAKSASTLLAVGADKVYLSVFGELGPLDTQIPDPRNPANTVSALDCYRSVDYVSLFGFNTISAVLPELVNATERRIPVSDLLNVASNFALGSVTPALGSVTALDFGGWARSLKIGEHYASKLLRAKVKDGDFARADRIASELVYGYTHHLFPIDYYEAQRMGLSVAHMDQMLYNKAIEVVDVCHKKDFVGFLSKEQSDKERKELPYKEAQSSSAGQASSVNGHVKEQHEQADVSEPTSWSKKAHK